MLANSNISWYSVEDIKQEVGRGYYEMKNLKRVVALAGVVLLVSLYIVSLVSAIFAKPYANSLFMASLFSTIVVPILIYGFLVVYKQVHKDEKEGVSIRKLKKMNKELGKKEKK